MTTRQGSSNWSPARWLRRIRRLTRGGGAPLPPAGAYVHALLAEFHTFIVSEYGQHALPQPERKPGRFEGRACRVPEQRLGVRRIG